MLGSGPLISRQTFLHKKIQFPIWSCFITLKELQAIVMMNFIADLHGCLFFLYIPKICIQINGWDNDVKDKKRDCYLHGVILIHPETRKKIFIFIMSYFSPETKREVIIFIIIILIPLKTRKEIIIFMFSSQSPVNKKRIIIFMFSSCPPPEKKHREITIFMWST